MARPVTLASMRTQARQKSDMTGSNFVTDSELDGYLNASAAELYDLLVDAHGEEYFLSDTPYEFSTVADTDAYDLPEGFYKLCGVDVRINGSGDWYDIGKYNFNERNRGQSGDDRMLVRYRLGSTKIRFTPAPKAVHSVRMWVIEAPPTLTDDADTFDGVAGWEEYIILDAAIKMLQKEESDASALKADKMLIKARIDRMKQNRDVGAPERITDIYAGDFDQEDFSILGSW